ncbi:unnamed protein product [Rhizoctonia solani]|uniref:Uncharacterized protein n=1 Tax=Rhizoctonia solani TaxID=456999 RepID=A0A8H3HSU2_9AGAM|nr:unnamed protein product [Rhizoctonia solani]
MDAENDSAAQEHAPQEATITPTPPMAPENDPTESADAQEPGSVQTNMNHSDQGNPQQNTAENHPAAQHVDEEPTSTSTPTPTQIQGVSSLHRSLYGRAFDFDED